MSTRTYLTALLFLLIPALLPAQTWEVDDCPDPEDKKAVKLVNQSQDRKKYKQPERVQFLKDAIDADDTYAQAYYLLGVVFLFCAATTWTCYGLAQKQSISFQLEPDKFSHVDPPRLQQFVQFSFNAHH